MLLNIYKEIYKLESSRNLVIEGFKNSFITYLYGKCDDTFTYYILDIYLASNIIRVSVTVLPQIGVSITKKESYDLGNIFTTQSRNLLRSL